MHGLGRRLAITLLPVLLLPLAAGCNQNSGGQFHSYQASNKLPEGEGADNSTAGKAPAGKVSGTNSSQAQAAQPEPATAKPKDSQAAAVMAPASPTPAMTTSKAADAATPSPSDSGVSRSSSPLAAASQNMPVNAPTASIPVASATAAAKGSQASGSSTARKVQVLIPNKTFRVEGDAGAVRVSYDDIDLLKVLNMDPVPADAATYFPAWLKALDGRRIRIRGFMYPTFQQTGVHAFGLARDNQICCFGRNPKIYDVFDVVLREGATTNYIPNRPFDVVGVFHIRPEAEDGKLYRLYEMDDAAVMTK